MDLKNDLSMVIIIISIIICYYYYYYYLLLLLKTFVKRKIRIDTPNALSQQLNRCLSLALKKRPARPILGPTAHRNNVNEHSPNPELTPGLGQPNREIPRLEKRAGIAFTTCVHLIYTTTILHNLRTTRQ